ncbi:Free methionine-R-sulfoxide reductase [Nakaseomyces bracarensis]|uniref:Free methionine-R-sulfoxide reductase n=1 Tax=Nakaseomyces bracarensis TaxID=273131 RepID=A0ABR4NVN9_9SACH
MGEEGKHHADYTNFNTTDRKEALQLLVDSYEALALDQRNWVCNLSNASSLLWHAYKSINVNVNWTGFYITVPEKEEMLLGPFQGKVACQTIEFGKGVCGASASTQETQVVGDVDKFPGHIACDGETKSEIVVPIVTKDRKTLGVIDLDCLDYNGFSDIDKQYLEKLAALIVETCDF